jgi:hypothetical protein
MRLAVISDVHFGDDLCTLVATGPDGEPCLGPAYPGNHDFDIWHTVEHQVNVINPAQAGTAAARFK